MSSTHTNLKPAKTSILALQKNRAFGSQWRKPCPDTLRCGGALKLRLYFRSSPLCCLFLHFAYPSITGDVINLYLFILSHDFVFIKLAIWLTSQHRSCCSKWSSTSRIFGLWLIFTKAIWNLERGRTSFAHVKSVCTLAVDVVDVAWVCYGRVRLFWRVVWASVPHGVPR